jgi:uncharacterized protein
MRSPETLIAEIEHWLSQNARKSAVVQAGPAENATFAVALSGGVDSLTLAVCAHRAVGKAVTMFHAVSPAVPTDATERVRRFARDEGFSLEVIDAKELENADYRRNPVNRCYFCKSSLYDTIRAHTGALIVSGTNLDDMGDYRPGLDAAKERGVRHPFVELEIDKASVRAIAAQLRLTDVAEMPAAPCLSSRVETGIEIDPKALSAIYACERLLQKELEPATCRCRLRKEAVVIELDDASLQKLDDGHKAVLSERIASYFARDAEITRPISFEPYRMGSAFLRGQASSDLQDK